MLGAAISAPAADWTSRAYVNVEAGANLLQDVEIKSIGNQRFPFAVPTAGRFLGTLLPAGAVIDKPKFSFDPGARFSLSGGCQLTDSIAAELETGFLYNSFNKVEYSASGFVSRELDFDANLWQVPFLANVIYTVPLHSRFKPFIGGGAGGIWSRIEGRDAGGDHDDVVFAYQGMAGVKYALNENVDIGLTYKFLGTLDQDFDGLKTEDAYNHSILAGLTWKF